MTIGAATAARNSQDQKPTGERNRDLMVAAGGLLLLLGAVHLGSALAGHPLWRGQHLGTALEYARSGINLWRPVIVGFTATGTPTIQELPLWQAAVALVLRGLGPWFGWANLVSLVLFATVLYPLFQLARRHGEPRAAWWALVAFLAQPLIVQFSGFASADGFAVVTAVWFAFFAVRLLEQPSLLWWCLAAGMGSVAAVSKLPFFMAAGVATLLLLVQAHRRSWRHWLWLGSVGAVCTVAFFGWTKYTSAINATAEFPLVDLSQPAWGWYCGDWQYRLNPNNWMKGAWRLLNCAFGSFALVAVAAYGWRVRRWPALGRLWLVGVLVTTLVFTSIVLHHSHYYLMICPAIAMLVGGALADCERFVVEQRGVNRRLWLASVMTGLVLAAVQGLIGMKLMLAYDAYPQKIAALIRQHTAPTDKLIIQGAAWDGVPFILSGRRGLAVWDTHVFAKPADYARLKQLGYNKFVAISDSPLVTILSQGGLADLTTVPQRRTYRPTLVPAVTNWPVVFQNDDVFIADIP